MPGYQRLVPLPPLSKDERKGRIADAEAAKTAAVMQEHWRLLYVAMTRAEEALFIGGSLGKREADRGVPHEDSWYARLAPLFEEAPIEDSIWGTRQEWGERAAPLVPDDASSSPTTDITLPRWVTTPVGEEPRPPRPLAPSAAGEEGATDEELESALQLKRQTLTPRRRELVLGGRVRDAGKTRSGKTTGAANTVWVAIREVAHGLDGI